MLLYDVGLVLELGLATFGFVVCSSVSTDFVAVLPFFFFVLMRPKNLMLAYFAGLIEKERFNQIIVDFDCLRSVTDIR